MSGKRIGSQVIVAIILFIAISVILEGEYTQDVVFEKVKTALAFGVVYAVFVVAREKFKNR